MNLLAHNNKSQICYCGQVSLQSAAVKCSFLTPLGVTFNLLGMVQQFLMLLKFVLQTILVVQINGKDLLKEMMMVVNYLYCVIVLVVLVMISSVFTR